MKKYQKIFSIFFLIILGISFFVFSAMAAGSIFGGLESARSNAGYSAGATLESQIGNIISVILEFVGVIFLGLMLYGGFVWMIARGNEQEVEKAKIVLEAAVIGLAVVAGAYAITYFVLQRVAPPPSSGEVTCAAGETPCACPGGTFCMDPSAWSGCDAFCAGEEP